MLWPGGAEPLAFEASGEGKPALGDLARKTKPHPLP
jgi:hypothetical protein